MVRKYIAIDTGEVIEVDQPDECPSCGEPLVDDGALYWCCPNPTCVFRDMTEAEEYYFGGEHESG